MCGTNECGSTWGLLRFHNLRCPVGGCIFTSSSKRILPPHTLPQDASSLLQDIHCIVHNNHTFELLWFHFMHAKNIAHWRIVSDSLTLCFCYEAPDFLSSSITSMNEYPASESGSLKTWFHM